MRTLVIESATEACSVALLEGGDVIASAFEVIGRGHAERLVPMIAELPGKGRSDRILVSLGPGSFTGVRIGLAAARALGLAWQAEVAGYPTLALVAAMARQGHPGSAVTVCMTGGHGEWFVQDFAPDGLPATPLASLPPQEAAAAARGTLLAGTRALDLAELAAANGGDERQAIDLFPDAKAAVLLPTGLVTSDLAPLYGRPPDARLPGERPRGAA